MRSIVGTWKLVAVAARDRNGNKVPDPYGGKPMGRVVFNAEGRMLAVTCDGRSTYRPAPSASTARILARIALTARVSSRE